MTRIHAGAFGALLAGFLLLTACTPNEGERCNPMLFNTSDQCAAGLSCMVPNNCGVAECVAQQQASMPLAQAVAACTNMCVSMVPLNAPNPPCGVAYCCPATGTSSDPNCQSCVIPGASSDGGTSG
jgi:hypothetical protein